MGGIFISSKFSGMEEHRRVIKDVIYELSSEFGVHVEAMDEPDVRIEPGSPRDACLAGVIRSAGFILILGQVYGDKNPKTGKSATHEEFDKANDLGLPIKVFTCPQEEMDDDQKKFLSGLRNWDGKEAEWIFTFGNLGELSTLARMQIRHMCVTLCWEKTERFRVRDTQLYRKLIPRIKVLAQVLATNRGGTLKQNSLKTIATFHTDTYPIDVDY